MSIVALQRLTLAGLANEQSAILASLQALGCLHLVPLNPAPREPERLPPGYAVEARQALRYLRDTPGKRRQVHEAADFDVAGTVSAVLANQQRLREVSDRRDALAQRARELAPWGDFELPGPTALAGRRLWFYILPERQLRALEQLELPWQVVHRDHRHAWVVVIHTEEPPDGALPVARTHTGALSLSEVRRRLEAAELELEEVEAERLALTRWIYLIASHLAQAEDDAGLRFAESQAYRDEALFLVQGWVAVADAPQVAALAEARGLAWLLEEPGPDDSPPTRLENPPLLAAGQDLVGFYQMPAYRAWDPSRVLFLSFTAFFAMILSDAGYAAVLALLLGVGWSRWGRSADGRRLRILGAALVGASLLWGVLVGSYFGVAPAPGSLWAQLKLFDINDFDTMMKLSVGIGVVHLLLANAEMARAAPAGGARYAALGWMAALLGGFLLWLGSGEDATAGLAGTGRVLFIAGLVAVLLLGSDRPVTGAKALALRLLDGLQALTRLTQAFGDVLSYLRLFALGLASASLALTFNGLARDIAASVPGLGLLYAILILVVGHLLNLALSLMSGVVHGLRLNFIEFYNWALSGEGYPFRPFKKTELSE